MAVGAIAIGAGLRRFLPVAVITLVAGLGVAAPASQAAVAGLRGASLVAAGLQDSCALQNGRAYCWGDNSDGQLGDGTTVSSAVPVAVDDSGVLAGKFLTQITIAAFGACALDRAGAAYCWGYNADGELGDDSTVAYSSVPVAVDMAGALAGQALTRISAGSFSICALDRAGAAYCWGFNGYGELGDATLAGSSVPVAVDTSGVLAGTTLTQIAVGDFHACVLDRAGAAYCWGFGGGGGLGGGELGDGNSDNTDVPVAVVTSGVLAGKSLVQITAGDADTCALDRGGAGYCWGINPYGQLSQDPATVGFSWVPVSLDTSGALVGKTLTQITAGGYHTCALARDGAAYCWGDDLQGELGDGISGDGADPAVPAPVAVDAGAKPGRIPFTQITAGYQHTCALDAAGTVYCWGYNTDGELGDGSTTLSAVPTRTWPQAPAGVTAVPVAGTAAIVSWKAPAFLNGATLTGYTAAADPGHASCRTTGFTTCILTGLAHSTTYHITVTARTSACDSAPSPSATLTTSPPRPGPGRP